MLSGRERSLVLTVLCISLVALGLFGMGTVSVLAQGEVCVLDNRLAVADQNKDGVVTIAELDRVIELTGNATVQASRDKMAAAGVTGIRYTECAPSVDGDRGDATPVASPMDSTSVAVSVPPSGNGEAGADGGRGAPITGSNLLIVGTGSMLVLAGAIIFRVSRRA
jgi:hypothetical protein